MRNTKWHLVEGLEFIQELAPLAARAGYGVALGGSVLTRGESKKDLDIIVFPLREGKERAYQLRETMIVDLQMKRTHTAEEVKAIWKRDHDSDDSKTVEVWEWLGKRIDIFYLR